MREASLDDCKTSCPVNLRVSAHQCQMDLYFLIQFSTKTGKLMAGKESVGHYNISATWHSLDFSNLLALQCCVKELWEKMTEVDHIKCMPYLSNQTCKKWICTCVMNNNDVGIIRTWLLFNLIDVPVPFPWSRNVWILPIGLMDLQTRERVLFSSICLSLASCCLCVSVSMATVVLSPWSQVDGSPLVLGKW